MTSGPENPAAGSSTSRTSRAVLQEFEDYADAQRLVDRLSDSGFPVEHVQIVRTGLRTVEQVMGADDHREGHPFRNRERCVVGVADRADLRTAHPGTGLTL